MACTLLSEANFNNLNEIKDIGKHFKKYYEVLNSYLDIIINKFHTYILIPILLDKTEECNTNISFIDENFTLYNLIKANSDELPDGSSLPDGYTVVSVFLTEYETAISYVDTTCPDEYNGVEFHPNMYIFYTEDELNLIQTKYNNVISFKEALTTEVELDTTDIFDIESRLNILVASLLSSI